MRLPTIVILDNGVYQVIQYYVYPYGDDSASYVQYDVERISDGQHMDTFDNRQRAINYANTHEVVPI